MRTGTKLLISILVLAFVLRVVGINYGVPNRFIGDEFVQVAISLTMLDERAFIPNFPTIFYHQPASAYISTLGIGTFLGWQVLTGVFESLSDMRIFYSINPEELLIVTRFISALLGTLSILFLYYAARDLFNRRVGLIAAFFGAVDFLTVYVHHSGRVWSYMSVFIALGLWASVKLYKNDSVKNYTKSVGATLLATATLLPGIFTFVPSFVARFNWRNKRMWISVLVLVVGMVAILAMNPRGIGALLFRFQNLSGSSLVESVTGQQLEYQVPEVSVFNRLIDTDISLFSYSPVFTLLFLIGMFFLVVRDRKLFWFIVSFPIVYYLFIGPFFTFGWVTRTLVPLSLYVALGAAYGANILAERFNLKHGLLASFIFLLAVPSIASSVWLDAKLLKDDTREQALEWIYTQLPENTKILSFSFTNEVINQNREVLELTESVTPEKLDTRQKTLLDGDDAIYPRPYYFSWDLRDIPRDELPEEFFKNNGFEYYLRTNWGSKDQDYFNEIIENQFSEKELIARFSPFKTDDYSSHNFLNMHNMRYPLFSLFDAERFGPIVEIYKINW